MSHTVKVPLLILLLFAFFAATAQQSQNAVTNRLIIKFKSAARPTYKIKRGHAAFSIGRVDRLNRKYGCTSAKALNVGRDKSKRPRTFVLIFSSAIDVKEAVDAYQGTGCLEYAEPDYKGGVHGTTEVTPNDANFFRQWSLYNNGVATFDSAIIGADISMKAAWDIETGDSSIIVAVIDGGAKLDHPEFAGRIWKNYAEIPGNMIDDDGNGYIDDVQGWNFAYDNNAPVDVSGHGTNVAGIIGANGNNTIGFAGVDWHCKLMILKGLDTSGFGYYSWWAEAMTYAADNGAKVINMSIGGSTSSITLQNAVDYAYALDVTLISTTGNENEVAPHYPGACNHIIAVGATNNHDCRANPFSWGGGSNFGSHISVVAPGNHIMGLSHNSNTNYTSFWGGTSQAAPHVSGLAALLLAQNPFRTPDQIKSILEATADDTVGNPTEDIPGWDQYYGFGRINAFRALSYAPSTVVRQVAENGKVLLYPNPTVGKVYVQLANVNTAVEYSVINMAGSLNLKGKITGNSGEIDMSSLPGGNYLINVQGGSLNYSQLEVLRKY